jgi:CRISPR/Cas system-associated exonuclease Cas4 (RecB family)
MAASNNPEQFDQIQIHIDKNGKKSEPLRNILINENIPYISYSQISSVEFCFQKYYLDYVEKHIIEPTPEYFVKGRFMHEIIAETYRKLKNNEKIDWPEYLNKVDNEFDGKTQIHLRNAVKVHSRNIWLGYEIVGIEEPFVIYIDEGVPGCIGYIDLILKKNDEIFVVDHKTGSNFHQQDELQMAIYGQAIKKKFNGSNISFYYDKYRWINNLNNIRKPSFERERVNNGENFWDSGKKRIIDGFRSISEIDGPQETEKTNDCFRCQFRKICWD